MADTQELKQSHPETWREVKDWNICVMKTEIPFVSIGRPDERGVQPEHRSGAYEDLGAHKSLGWPMNIKVENYDGKLYMNSFIVALKLKGISMV